MSTTDPSPTSDSSDPGIEVETAEVVRIATEISQLSLELREARKVLIAAKTRVDDLEARVLPLVIQHSKLIQTMVGPITRTDQRQTPYPSTEARAVRPTRRTPPPQAPQDLDQIPLENPNPDINAMLSEEDPEAALDRGGASDVSSSPSPSPQATPGNGVLRKELIFQQVKRAIDAIQAQDPNAKIFSTDLAAQLRIPPWDVREAMSRLGGR